MHDQKINILINFNVLFLHALIVDLLYIRCILVILYNYSPKGRWIVVDIYRDAKRWGIYPLLLTNPEGDSCFSIYQN